VTTPDLLLDEKSLRKAWLKKKFASWEYHEELLTLHDKYLSAMHAHWARPEIQRQYPDFHRTMASPVFLNFDKVSKPGDIPRAEWNKKKSVGWADSIAYNFNRGLGDFGPPFTEYAGMDDAERKPLNDLVAVMLRRCTNIRRTVEETWERHNEDVILSEEFTGPVSWTETWRSDLLGERGAALVAAEGVRVKAGDPVPQSGMWQALDVKGTRQVVQAGARLPDLHSAYGATIWQFVQA
jgi:hypothetical protein